MSLNQNLVSAKRIVIKIGSSSLTHEETGGLHFSRLEKFVRSVANFMNMGKEIVIVTSGAIAVGTKALNLKSKPTELADKQAAAAVGQAVLMMIYQKLFREYNHIAGQVLLTKDVIEEPLRKTNAYNTLNTLIDMKAIPVVNENDTVSTEEIEFGDNDTLSAIVAELINADLLILLSDIDGLYTDDPRHNPDATLIPIVREIDERIEKMGKGAGSNVGTGGMATKISAAKICSKAEIDMIITNATKLDNLDAIVNGELKGTLFIGRKNM